MNGEMRQYRTPFFARVVLLFFWVGCSAPQFPQDERPKEWATRVSKPGLTNLHQISPTLYRGAQPTVQGFKELHKMGVKTIVNLRGHHSDDDEVKQAGLEEQFQLVAIPEDAWDVSKKEVIFFLRVVADASNHPIFFHCKHGADRTGTMAAAHRIVNDGWNKKDALNEMKYGGFGFHTLWINLPRLVEDLDVAEVKKAVSKK